MQKSYRGFSLIFLVVIVALLFVGFIFFRSHQSKSRPAGIPCQDCNVIVIGVDTLRADHVHTLSYPLATTPTLDALAARGYTFTQAIAASSWTVPSFMSIFTGVFPSVHKVVNKYVTYTKDEQTLSNLKQLSPDMETLAEQMKAAGYATGGFTGDAGVSAKFGYNQGFDAYTDEKTFGGFANSDAHAMEWLDGLPTGQKFFMFFHGYDLHGQYDLPKEKQLFVPAEYTGKYTGTKEEESALREEQLVQPLVLSAGDAAFWTGLYDSKIRAADTQLGNFLDQLKQKRLLDNTVIIVVADHGEEFYEHGGFDHGQSLYDELVHVPLIFVVPGVPGGVKIPAQVSTMDIAGTLLKMVGVAPSQQFQKQIAKQTNLLTYFSAAAAAGSDVFTETDYRDFTHQRSVRTADGWKLIVNLVSGKEELYHLTDDPGEKKNLALDTPEKTAELRSTLRDHIINDLHASPDAPAPVGCLPVYAGECQ